LFGWKPRSEGVFATGALSDTTTYGKYSFIIFPKDGFKFLWSEDVNDFFTYAQYEEDVQEAVVTYKDNDLVGAIRSYNEIMIKCEGYYVVSYIEIDALHKYIIQGYKA
jgi:hypothetical protein